MAKPATAGDVGVGRGTTVQERLRKALDAVVAGTDPVALDAWAFEHLLERGRDHPLYLHKAEEKGSGRVDYRGRVREITG